MKESEQDLEQRKSLLEDNIPEEDDNDDNFDNDEEIDKNNSCCRCCCCCCCCCCCHSNLKGKKYYQKNWRQLAKEGNDSSDEPFTLLTNLFSKKDGSIQALESLRLNPNLVSTNKLRNDLEFYIPQLCTFILFGGITEIEEFFVFLCRVCNASFFFAHRINWFLSAMINSSQEKKNDIIDMLKMINTLFKSENPKKKNKINKFYLANSVPFIKYIKSHNLYFLYDKSKNNVFEDVDFNKLDGYQQEIFNKYKNSREKIIDFSENEYNIAKEKEEESINNKNNKNERKNLIITEDKSKKNHTKFKANDFFIDLSNFNLLNKDPTEEDEFDIDEMNERDSFLNVQKTIDINFFSYRSTLNFIEHLCDISNELPNFPIDEQKLYLYRKLLEINKQLPCNVYLPFLAESTRNYLICHIPLDGVKIFRTKTRCPIMLTFEMIRIEEINKENKNDEEFGLNINMTRARSISSYNSVSLGIEKQFKKDIINEKIKDGHKENIYKNDDYILSKPILLKKPKDSSRLTTISDQNSEKKFTTKNEMSVIAESKEEENVNELKNRPSINSNLSTDSSNEENNEKRLIQIVNRFRRNSITYSRDINTIYESKGPNLNDLQSKPLESKTFKEKSFTNLDKDISELKEIMPKEEDENEIKPNKTVNADDIRNIQNVFGEPFRVKEQKLKKASLFGNLNSYKTFRCIFKTHEDLRQEQFATQLINEFSQIFKLEDTGCWLNTYEIISTGNDSGLVEMVNDSVSISELKKKISNNVSLHDFYLYNYGRGNPNSHGYKKAMENYIASLAGYSLVCYFLQIKDRHNENILIDNEGHLVHIDFGFLLSNAPGKGLKFETAPFKLNNDMVHCLGGVDGKDFDRFTKLLKKGFIAVNKHRKKILTLVEMMWCGHGKNLDCFEGGQEAIDQLKLRLNPKENMSQVDMKKFVDTLIKQSVDNWRTKWYDYFQYCFQGIFY